MSAPEREKYKIVGPATWALIRSAYLAGESAPTLAERYDVSIHAIRRRATLEKWTKRAYAAALEAQGLPGPKKPPLPNYVEEAVVREQARVAAEEVEAEQRDAEIHAWIEKVAAEEDALDIADALEWRALAEASAAVVQGRAKDAQALASLAQTMRKHRSDRAAAPGRVVAQEKPAASEEEEIDAGQRAAAMMELFGRVAFIANAMVHQPSAAPAAFVRMIKRWRELNLGEGAEDAEAAAAIVAAAHKHHLDGAWLETTPEDVRAYLKARWEEVRNSFQ